MQPYKQICIYRGSFITRFQPGMIISLYCCFMLHHNMFVFQIVLTILYYIKHQLCSLYVYSSFCLSCFMLQSYISYVFMLYFATICLPIYFYSTDLQATESERRIPRFPVGSSKRGMFRDSPKWFSCVCLGLTTLQVPSRGKFTYPTKREKENHRPWENDMLVPRRVVCSWSSVALFSSHSLTVDSQTAGMLE